MSLTKATYSMIEGAAYNVLDFGADPTGVASSVAAFNAALANGGTVYVPTGVYKLNSRVNISVDDTTLFLAANVTLNLSGVPATQTPFGNQIHVFADNCAVIGSGPSSVLQITGGSQANAVGILHHYGLTVRDLTIDGDKAGGVAFTDDTFMSGVSVVASTAGGATQDAKAIIDNCIIRNFLQYGVNIYGEWASGTKVVNCTIYDNGKTADALSVGSGIVVTRGVSRITIANNTVTNNKFMGLFFSSAGVDSIDWTVTGNICSDNGDNGIGFTEIATYASVTGVGMKNITLTGNTCCDNGRTGIELLVDTVGYLKQFSITGNVCNDNTLNGVGLITSNTAPDIISDVVLSANQTKNNGGENEGASIYAEDIQGLAVAFTPVVQGSTSAGTATYASQLGTYVRVGPIVTFQLLLDWSGHTGTGDMQIAGFPYAAKTGEPTSDFWVFTSAITITGQATLGISSGQTFGPVGAINNGAYSTLAMDAAGLLRVSGSYFVDA
jgi:hypothetical protein